MALEFNPLTGKFDVTQDPGGAAGQAQFFGADGSFAGAAGLQIDPPTGRVNLQSFLAQQSAPATPASAGFVLYAAPTTGALSWRGANGFIRTLNATGNTADRSYQLQDKSGTIAHLDDVFDGYSIGGYIMPVYAQVSSGSALAANTIFTYPFKVDRRIKIDELGCRVFTPVASSAFQLAIYNSASGLPATLLASTSDMSGAVATVLSSAITESTLEPGRPYWFAINANAAINFVVFTGTFANAIIGAPTLAAAISGAGAALWGRQFNQTYGTWPDLTGQTTSVFTQPRQVAFVLRVSALL